MKFIGVTEEILDEALALVNERYAGNVMFDHRDFIKTRQDGREEWRVQLKVCNSRGPGARLSLPNAWLDKKPRHLPASCWHVYGHFYDEVAKLAPDAEMDVSGSGLVEPYKGLVREHGWRDNMVGSPFGGYYMISELCHCDE